MSIIDFLAALLYPPRCAACGRPLHEPGPPRLCRRCSSRLGSLDAGCARCGEPGQLPVCRRCSTDPPPFRQARACFPYSTASAHAFARAAVLRWKYGHDLVLGAALARHLARSSPLAGVCYDAIVPVPSHRARLARRGFNQAALLARSVARARGMRVAFALGRRAAGPSQTSLGREERRANIAATFYVRDERAIRRRRVLLVDDVLTTTATTRACADALLAAGAAVVDVAALARTTDAPLRGDSPPGGSSPPAGRRR